MERAVKCVLLVMLIVACRLAAGQIDEAKCVPLPDDRAKVPLACDADLPTCEVWRTFRATRPYPYQSLYVSKAQEPDQYTVIVSEAPPVAAQPLVAALVAATFGVEESAVSLLRYPQGLDGWLVDIAVTVRARKSQQVSVPSAAGVPTHLPADLARRLDYLNAALFGTREGFYVDVESSDTPQVVPSANLKVSTAEVISIVSDRKLIWRALGSETQEKIIFNKIEASGSPSAFISLPAGVVALHIPSGSALGSVRTEFRKFAIASDYLVGALRTKRNGLLLLGRTRLISLRQLPPLRFETFASLAASAGQPLGQSYERQRVFAGKIDRGQHTGWDWAPIYLSAQLQDTEFGTLLNIADQQLKSWSECGRIRYSAFDYPAPASFPFTDQPASVWMFERTSNPSLIYNWNTQAFASAVDTPAGRVITMSSTGALPVSYIVPKMDPAFARLMQMLSQSKEAETAAPAEASVRGSEYFASLGDSILERVVQNVFLYQVLGEARPIHAKVSERTVLPRARHDIVAGVLRDRTKAWLTELPASDQESIRKSTARFAISQNQLIDVLIGAGDETHALTQLRRDIELTALSSRAVEERLTRLIEERTRLVPLYDAAFENTCRGLNGTIVDSGKRCSYQALEHAPKPVIPYADEIDKLSTMIQAGKVDYITLEKKWTSQITAFERIIKQQDAANRIATDLKPLTSQISELDKVLADVMQATGSSGSPGFIRTPSVVLSRNSVEIESVGGHNIDGLPWLVKPLAKKGGVVLTSSADARPTFHVPADMLGNEARAARSFVIEAKPEAAVPRAMSTALEMPSPVEGSFLAKLQSMVELPSADLSLLTKANTCHCDYFVHQGDAGTANIVKLKPPPSKFNLFGDSALVSELSKSSSGSRIVFDGFEPERAIALVEAGNRRRVVHELTFKERIDEARHLFQSLADDVTQKVIKTWETAKGNRVNLVGDKTSLSQEVLQSTPVWKNSKIKVGPIVDGEANLTQVEIIFPEMGARVKSIEVHASGDSVADAVLHRSVSLARSRMQLNTTLEAGVGKVVDQIYADVRGGSVRSVEFHLKGAGAVSVLRFPLPIPSSDEEVRLTLK